MNRIFHLIGLLSLSIPAIAGEYAVLANGFRIHADGHEINGAVVRLHQGEGVTEMPADSVMSFEAEETQPAPSAAPKAQIVAAPEIAIAQTSVPQTPEQLAAQAAKKYALPESFVKSVMRAESDFQTGAVSPKGATGLMQLMPDTARHLGVDPKIPAENAEGGARYLRELLAKYESDPQQVVLALAAYNAGPGAVEKYGGVPPYRETREYILRVLKAWDAAGNK